MKTNNNLSSRHHYIPQFYLNGFTNDSGCFKIYDVQHKKYKKNGFDFTPKTHFFVENGNTVNLKSSKTDIVEKWYSSHDNKIKDIFEKINSGQILSLVDKDIAAIEFFVGVLYWRLPNNFLKIKDLIQTRSLPQLGISVIDKSGNKINNEVAESELKFTEPELFEHFMKYYYPHITYKENVMNDIPSDYVSFITGTLPKLCSDNPILCRNPETFRVYGNQYIFPLNYEHVLFHGDKKIFNNQLKIEIDLLSYKQAFKYVSVTSANYIEMLDDLFYQSYKTIDNLREYLFGECFNVTN